MEDKNKDFEYTMGRVCGYVLVGCVMAISIAATVKVIMWIL